MPSFLKKDRFQEIWNQRCSIKILQNSPLFAKTYRENSDISAATEVYISAGPYREVLNDYSSSCYNLFGLFKPTLHVPRLKAIALEAYKCKVNGNPDYIVVILNPLIAAYEWRGGPCAEQLMVNTTSYDDVNSFTYQVPKLWNEMASVIKEVTSLLNFKSFLSIWTEPECHLGPCIFCKIYAV